jgi:hypothetical protein
MAGRLHSQYMPHRILFPIVAIRLAYALGTWSAIIGIGKKRIAPRLRTITAMKTLFFPLLGKNRENQPQATRHSPRWAGSSRELQHREGFCG